MTDFQNPSSSISESHILKFIIKGKPIRTDIGIKTTPQQTYGVSEDSPDHFKGSSPHKGKTTLIADNGYIYSHQDNKNFDHFSQKKYYSIDGSGQQNFRQEYQTRRDNNPMSFHRKKGRLTQFMQKNGWMSAVVPIMGHQRSPQARDLEHQDRRKRINSLKPKRIYENKLLKTGRMNARGQNVIDQNYFQTRPELMSQKLQIRKKRNQLAELQVPISSRTIFNNTNTIEEYQRQAMEDKMAKTARGWTSSTKTSSFYQPVTRVARRTGGFSSTNNYQQIPQSNKAVSQMATRPKNSYEEHHHNPAAKGTISPDLSSRRQVRINIKKGSNNKPVKDDHADDIYSKTAYSTASKWVYKKKPKLDTDQQTEQAIQI